VCQGTCVPCGFLGAPCCQGGDACPGDAICSENICQTCCARCYKSGVKGAAQCVFSNVNECAAAANNYCKNLGQTYFNHFWTTNCEACKW
jgi:hypothetical protein